MASLTRIISIFAYFFIFLQGSMILLPFGLLLLSGVFTAEPPLRVLIGLADAALVFLVMQSFFKRTRWTTFFEVIVFFVLLLPILKIFLSFSFEWFNYFPFLFPAGCFIIFFPLSIFLAHAKFVKDEKNAVHNLDF